MSNSNLSELIKVARINKGLNQDQFGQLFKPPASKSIVSRWESGKSTPSPERLKELSNILKIPIEELLFGSLKKRIEMLIENSVSTNTDNQSFFEFVSKSKDIGEQSFLKNVYRLNTFLQYDDYGVKYPIRLDEDDEEYSKKIDKYYETRLSKALDYIVPKVEKIAKIKDIKNYDDYTLMAIITDVAEKHFDDYPTDNNSFIDFVSHSLTNLVGSEIFSSVYTIDVDQKPVNLGNVSNELFQEVEEIIYTTIKKIENLKT